MEEKIAKALAKFDGGVGVACTGFSGRVRIESLGGKGSSLGDLVRVGGWVRSIRKQQKLLFITLNDGSSCKDLQIVVEDTVGEEIFNQLATATTGASIELSGTLEESPNKQQNFELKINDKNKGHVVHHLGVCDTSTYPLSKKFHHREYLRELGHLRPRTYLFGCVNRIRSALSMATHQFFQHRGFLYVHTPIITSSDCEGGGEMFEVTTLLPPHYDDKTTSEKREANDPDAKKDKKEPPSPPRKDQLVEAIPTTKHKTVDYAKDFFAKQTFLTVSGQLAVEPFCISLGDVYTFGPTFRAENSHTSRHLAEFWMIEPEIAFAQLEDVMRLATEYVRFCIQFCLKDRLDDLKWLATQDETLIDRLLQIVDGGVTHMSYTEVIDVLKKEEIKYEQDATKPKDEKPQLFKERVHWGMDLGSEHERYLTDELVKGCVIVYNYPASLKAFYMKQNPLAPGESPDRATVRAMDFLVPRIGELVGGSQREDDLEKLDKLTIQKGLDPEAYWWYRQLRQFGSVPHGGFGLGFERLVMLVTGVENIKDVIPYPRFPGHADF